jgi:hypothetical protein
MITRSLMAISFALLSPMMAAQAFGGSPGSKCSTAPAERCVATGPETVVYGSLSDHGPGYDSQGNAVDRQGNVVAVPEGRSTPREVFLSDSRW